MRKAPDPVTLGCCTGANPWIIGLFKWLERQHDRHGTLHANPNDTYETAKLAVTPLNAEFSAGGRTRAARGPVARRKPMRP